MKRKSWWGRAVDALLGKDEISTPPSYRRQAEDFGRHHPEATVGDWVEAYQRACALAWEAGYQAGYVTKVVGVVELPSDRDVVEVPPIAQHDLSKVVVLQEADQLRNVMFVNEEGLRVE
jgi:hypothetical protein